MAEAAVQAVAEAQVEEVQAEVQEAVEVQAVHQVVEVHQAVEVQEVYQEPAHQARRVQIPTMQEAIQMQILQAVIIR